MAERTVEICATAKVFHGTTMLMLRKLTKTKEGTWVMAKAGLNVPVQNSTDVCKALADLRFTGEAG